MILLKKLTLNNFLSHENTELVFDENEKVLVEGASGAGKSSVFDAILWALYGEGRTDNRSLVRKGTKKGSVSLELARRTESEDDTVIVTRTTTATGKHTLEVAIQSKDGTTTAHTLTGIRELQNWINTDLVGASYLLSVNSIAYVQGNTESFVTQTAPKRKELLLEIVKAEDYKKYYENARQRLVELGNEQNHLSGQIVELGAQLAALEVRTGGKEAHLSAIEAHTKRLAEIEPEIKALEGQRESFAVAQKTADVLAESLKQAILDKDTAQNVLDKAHARVGEKDSLVLRLGKTEGHPKKIEEVTARLGVLRESLAAAGEIEAKRSAHQAKKPLVRDHTVEIARHKRQIETLEEHPVCPAGVACPFSSTHIEAIAFARTQIEQLVQETNKSSLELATWAIEESALPQPTNMREIVSFIGEAEAELKILNNELVAATLVQKDIDALVELEATIPTLEATLVEKAVKVEEVRKKKEASELLVNQGEITRITTSLAKLVSDRHEHTVALTQARSAVGDIDRMVKEIGEIKDRTKEKRTTMVAVSEKMRTVGLVKEAFGSKGVETMVIDYLLPKLEDRINAVLSKLSDFSVRLDTQRKSADGEGVVEGLWITICNETGEELPYESYSGGEKVRITFAIAEAFASLAQQKVGFRLVDEAVLALDENSLESFLGVVTTLLSDFNQVLFISHVQEVKDLFEKQIHIVKRGGISQVA